MRDFLITADASKVSLADFLRGATGRQPRTAVEIAEADARKARLRLADTIQRAEYAQARREREAIIRDRIQNGTGDYEDYKRRVNEPCVRAAERVNRRMAEFDRKLRRAA